MVCTGCQRHAGNATLAPTMNTRRQTRPSTALAVASLISPPVFVMLAGRAWQRSENRGKAVMAVACTVAVLLFWLAGRYFGIPRHPDFEASLALQPRPAAVLLLTGFVLWICVAVCTAITSRVRLDAGLCTACIGLATLSVRGGPMRYVFQAAIESGAGRGVFVAMAVEL